MTDITLRAMHCSMQFSDSTKHKKEDAKKIMARAANRKVAWVTGTEAGAGRSMDLRAALEKESQVNNYRFMVRSDTWIAVDRDVIVPQSYSEGYIKVTDAVAGVHSAEGISWVQFTHPDLGVISIGASHYMTKGRKPGDPYYQQNMKLTRAIGSWGKEHGAGGKLAFYGADANIPDRTDDVFLGAPFTTLADELKDWQNTGHGSIDIIASYDADGRVKGKSWNVLDDKELFLNTDHFACEGAFTVRAVKAKTAR